MDFKGILFIIMIIVGFISPHLFLYYSLINFFTITAPRLKKGLLISSWILPFTFFIAAILNRLFDNPFTRVLNVTASTWLGIMLYLFMAMLLVWFIIGVLRLTFKLAINKRNLAITFSILAIGYAGYGIWHAAHPQIKSINVKLDNLPAYWKNKQIVQLSDVHLGSVRNTGFLTELIKKLEQIQPDLILITGDLFDGMNGDVSRFKTLLKTITAKEGVYFVTGNHEGYLGLTNPLQVIRQTNIQLLDNQIITIKDLQLVGISFPEFDKPHSFASLFDADGSYTKDKPAILLYHTPTNIIKTNANRGEQQFSTYWSPDNKLEFVKSIGIDLQLSGHTHAGQLWPFGYLTRLLFGKVHYGLHQQGNFHIYTSPGTGTWGPPMRTGGNSEIVVITLK